MRAFIMSGLLGLVVGGCLSVASEFTCTTDDQCTLDGVAGVCEATTSRCSTADTTCPSQRRYGKGAGDMSGDCVPLSPSWDKVADWCPLASTNVMDSSVREHSGLVNMNPLVSDVQEVPKVSGLVGPDGVLGFSLAAGERVSIRYDFDTPSGSTAPPVDLAMYLMGSCDVASFIRRNERCPAGQGEDMWWQMNDVPNTYYLGFDTHDYDAGAINLRVKLTVSFPRYGDGVVDFGEACDDSNRINGDGCTADGLWELKNTGVPIQEKEPNNHPFGGNLVIMNPGETATIVGSTGDTCDLDFYSIDVPQGAFPRVTMLDFNGQPCVAADIGVVSMQFNRLDGTRNVEEVKLGEGKPVAPNACPSWTETSLGLVGADGGVNLPAGRYGIELKGFEEGKKNLPYRLKIEMVTL